MDNRSKVKALLKETRMSVRELARRCDVSHTTIYRWLNGDTPTIKEDLLQKMAKAFGASPYIFIENNTVAMDVQLKADYIKSELIKMQITDDEFDKLEDYIQFLKSKRR